MHVLNALAQYRNPVLGELVLHDIAGVEMNLQIPAAEAVHEFPDFIRAERCYRGVRVTMHDSFEARRPT